MEATVQMNTRLSRSMKSGGDAVLAQLGLNPSQAVRALWSYLCTHQDVPPFMKEVDDDASAEQRRKLALIKHGAGLAVKIAQEQCGYTGPVDNPIDKATWQELRDDMYDEMLDEMESRCV